MAFTKIDNDQLKDLTIKNNKIAADADIEQSKVLNLVSDLNDIRLDILDRVIKTGDTMSGQLTISSGGINVTGDSTFVNNLTIQGDLTVQGTQTFINSETLQVNDNSIELNADITTNAQNFDGGIKVKRLDTDDTTRIDAEISWNETIDLWQVGSNNTLSNIVTELRLGSVLNGLGASLVGIEDAGGNFSSSNVESALAELRAYVDGLVPANFLEGFEPSFVSTSSLQFKKGRVALDNGLISEISSPTTVNLSNVGLNGIAQSDFLAGTCGTSGVSSNTVTFAGIDPSTLFIYGDVIWTSSGSRRITEITSTTVTVDQAITIPNGSQYKRGGLASNTGYYVYLISDGITPGFLLTNRSVKMGEALVDLPAGYNNSWETPLYLSTDTSSNLLRFKVSNWGYSSIDLLIDEHMPNDGSGVSTLHNGFVVTTSPIAVHGINFIPKTANIVKMRYIWDVDSSGDETNIFIYPKDSPHLGFMAMDGYIVHARETFELANGTDSQFQFHVEHIDNTYLNLYTMGYKI